MGSYQQSLAEAGQMAPGVGDAPHWPASSAPVSGLSSFLRFLSGSGIFVTALTCTLAAEELLLHLTSSPVASLSFLRLLQGLTGRAMLASAAAAGTVAVAWWERLAISSFGFTSRHPGRNLLGGTLAGLALLSALILLLHQQDLLVFRGQVLFGTAAEWRLGLRWSVLCGAAAFAEEAVLHGYLQYSLTRAFASVLSRRASGNPLATAFWASALMLSIGFAVLQQWIVGGSHLVLLNAVLFSLLMAFSLWRTGAIWWAIGFHAAWDWAQSFLWGVPNAGTVAHNTWFLTDTAGSALRSGGAVGPNGSAYTAGALAAGVAILQMLHRSRVYPDLQASSSKRVG